MGCNFSQILIGDLGGSLMHDLLEANFALPLLRPKSTQPFADRHEIARPKQRVTADILEGRLLFTGIGVGDRSATKERLERIGAPSLRAGHYIALQQTH